VASKINGFTAGYTVAGAIVLWSGIKGSTLSDTVRSALKGSTTPQVTESITGSSSSASSTSSGSSGSVPAPSAASGSAATNQAIAKILAAPYGWSTGSQWNALVALWNRESGWNALATNPSSGAFGIPQALGHGNSTSGGSHGDEYPNTLANNGDATAEIAWGLNYIQTTYGNPVNAWSHETANGWY
jgi:resuscitation-promoting factor RpfB